MNFIGLKDEKEFPPNYINPSMEAGVIVMINPEKPKSYDQKYVEIGRAHV